jgi:stromal membrane-associated protein
MAQPFACWSHRCVIDMDPLMRRDMCGLQDASPSMGQCQPRHLPLRALRLGPPQDGHSPLQSVSTSHQHSVYPLGAPCRAMLNHSKSVTLDSWSRENITAMKQMGNKASNAIWNPNEALHPTPTAFGAEERDSELEKYIRRKYEQGAFRADARSNAALSRAAPTSLNRAREADGRLASGSVTGLAGAKGENRRNPELNDIVWKKDEKRVDRDRDLPALPVSANGAAPRSRPIPTAAGSAPVAQPSSSQLIPNVNGTTLAQRPETLVDLNGGTSSTLPLQINVSSSYASPNAFNPFAQGPQLQQQHHQQQYTASSFHPQYSHTTPLPQNAFATGLQVPSPNPGYTLSTSAPSNGMYNSLSSFDPLHPASQQQQQHQQTHNYPHQPPQSYNTGPNHPGAMFQQQSFTTSYGQTGGMGMSNYSAPQQITSPGQPSMQFMQQAMAGTPNGQYGVTNGGGMVMNGYHSPNGQWNSMQQMGMANGYMAGGLR